MIGYFQTVGAYGDHLDAIPADMTWGHVDMLSPAAIAARGTTQATNEALAVRCQARGMQVAYNVAPLLWIPGTTYSLHPDWQDRLDYHRTRYIDAFHTRGVLHSLYLADEPYANGLAVADVQAVAAWVHANTPYPTMIVEHFSKREEPRPIVDYYGLSAYSAVPFLDLWEFVTETPAVNVVVGQAFHEQPNAIPDQWRWFALHEVIKSRQGALLSLFLYPSFTQGLRSYIGTANDPAVQAVHQAWAQA